VAGLEAAVGFALDFRFSDEDLAFLARIKPYDRAFLDELGRLRFSGEILAMPEGTVGFAPEPLLRVTAPFREALLLESGLLHAVGRATLIATKAARVVLAAAGRPVAEFALRRAAEPLLVARSAAIGGCAATSYVEAARRYGLAVSGTIPHALVQAFPSEVEAFRAVAATLDDYTLLLDTYGVSRSLAAAVAVANEGRERWGHRLAGVRLDSGDLAADSREVRRVLDEAGLAEVKVLASGDLDEYVIADLLGAGAPIDGFGVGTSVGVGAGSVERGIAGGALGAVYKLVWYDADPGRAGEEPRIKLAGAKSTWPGRKQVYRRGDFGEDVIQGEGEPAPAGGTALLRPAVVGGAAVAGGMPALGAIRERAAAQIAALPGAYRRLEEPALYPIRWSDGLRELRRRTGEFPWQGVPPRAPE
jgi:nicotinate phosphoribosyltransferase